MKIGYVLVAVALAGLWLQAELRRAEARGSAIEMARNAQEARAALNDSIQAFDARESISRGLAARQTADLDSLRGLEARLRTSGDRSGRQADSILASLAADTTIPATLAELGVVMSALDTLRQVGAACRSALAVCDSLRTDLQSRLEDQARVLGAARLTIGQQDQALEALRDVAGQSRGFQLPGGPLLSVGLGVLAALLLLSR